MAWAWLFDDDKSKKKEKGDDKGRRKGERNHDASKNDSASASNLPRRATHQSYLDGPRGTKVSYSNCYCSQTSDHSRGTY